MRKPINLECAIDDIRDIVALYSVINHPGSRQVIVWKISAESVSLESTMTKGYWSINQLFDCYIEPTGTNDGEVSYAWFIHRVCGRLWTLKPRDKPLSLSNSLHYCMPLISSSLLLVIADGSKPEYSLFKSQNTLHITSISDNKPNKLKHG